MGAPNLTPEAVAALRLELAGKLAAAQQEHARLVERDSAAENFAQGIETTLAETKKRRDEVQTEIANRLDGVPDMARTLDEAIKHLNGLDERVADLAKDAHRARSDLGTARAERNKAAEAVSETRERLRRLLAP